MAKKSDKDQSFEQSLGELESLVSRMEKGDLTLEESLAQYERGVTLTRACEEALEKARQKIEQLSLLDPSESAASGSGDNNPVQSNQDD